MILSRKYCKKYCLRNQEAKLYLKPFPDIYLPAFDIRTTASAVFSLINRFYIKTTLGLNTGKPVNA